MTSTKLVQPEIVAQSHRLTYLGPNAHRLTVEWQIGNPAKTELYLVLATPVVTMASDPLILDHTTAPDDTANANLSADFRIVPVAAMAARSETLTYGIGLALGARINVIGRFGFSYVAPNPRWEDQQNWRQVKNWLRLVESARFTVTG